MKEKILINKDGMKTIEDFLQKKTSRADNDRLINRIFKDKRPDYTEIEISFFELCNLHCRFCWQDNYNPTGINTIPEKADIAIDYLVKNKENIMPNIQVHMLGGELFEDSIDYYDQYFDFIIKIKEHCDINFPEKPLTFVFLTNMNFQLDSTLVKLENFLNKLKAHNCEFILTTSWDPTGRPLAGEITTRFHYNITYFKQYLSEITFVLTKQTIKKLISRQTPYLDLLIKEGFRIDYDYYMPTTQVDSLMPSDRELYNGLSCLLKHYPSIDKLKVWAEQERGFVGKMSCASLNKITILPDGTITNCRHLNYNQNDFETEIFNESNSDIILKYVSTKECLSCPYFVKCPLSCFVMSDHKKFTGQRELDECLYRKIFKDQATI
jgi:radical SAM protein with 4Fe4S-binding SPASM domain